MNVERDKELKVYVFDSEYGKIYSCAINEKKQDGTYKVSFIELKFRKEIEFSKPTIIKNIKGWLKPTNNKNKVVLFINEFDLANNTQSEEKEEDPFENFNGEVILTDNDLPF